MKAAEDKAMHNAQAAEMMCAYLEKRGAIQELMEVENPDPAAHEAPCPTRWMSCTKSCR